MGEPNILLAGLISEAGISNAGLAIRVNQVLGTHYDHTAVARWVRDHALPRGRAPLVICDILSRRLGRTVLPADAGLDPRAATASPDLEAVLTRTKAMWRHDSRDAGFLAGVAPAGGAGVILPLFEWENPPGDRDVSRRGRAAIGLSDVERLHSARRRYEEMYRRAGGIPVRPRLARFLTEHATPLLSAAYSDSTGRRLHRAVGSLTALAGICAYDASRQALAQRYFLAALRMAKASGDRAFGAYVVALLSNQAMAAAEYRLVIQYCETALRAAKGALTPALTSDLCTMQARAFARMGDRQSCHTQMALSESMAGRIRADAEPEETSYVQPGLLETQHAEALRRLGDLAPAERYAHDAVLTAHSAHLRGQVHRYAGLALIRAQRGRVDEALEPARQMLRRVRGMESGRLHDRLRSVRTALASRSDQPDVRDFVEHADAELGLGV
ncbi:transcriptional regulator [Streptomonospora nanhaiensis]|uniref:transcriptional regulator n=1 Tax=Streptomonospora nanhaiensis TaxID=1323731 RepID=UPI001C9991F0|nr:transcriptional regulator [Streptomonospora nanhaiensis]MBX9389538.1 transcriptional regulator [Streptomonospora nanhaiensis]